MLQQAGRGTPSRLPGARPSDMSRMTSDTNPSTGLGIGRPLQNASTSPEKKKRKIEIMTVRLETVSEEGEILRDLDWLRGTLSRSARGVGPSPRTRSPLAQHPL